MNDNEIKVSQLIEATDLNENDLFMIVQNGVNKKLTGNKIGGNEIVISTTEEDITAKTKLFINSLTKEAKFKDGNNWETLAGDEVLVSTTQPTSADNKLWVDTAGTMPYVNSEIAIGSSNPTNQRVWFKQSRNIMNSNIEQGTYTNSGVKDTSTTNYRNATPIAVEPNTTYTFSINGVSQKYALYYYTASMTHISSEGLTTGTFTTPANCYYINFRCFNADYTSDYANLKIQLELGSTATTYEAYVTPSINVDGKEIYNQNVMNYSSAEQVIGKWIDGKPLYRSVFNITNPASTNTNYVDISSLNIDTATHLYGYYKTNAGTFGIPFHDSNDNLSVMFISGSDNLYIRGRFGNNYTNITEVKVILEYTKTTD